MSSPKSVCIIGAGVSGLITTKVFLDDSENYEVTVFEKSDDLGGLWHSSRVYPGLRTNNMKYTYGFSELPVPDNFDEYPTAAQMYQYFDAYARKFKLRDHIQFGVEVIKTHLIQEGADEQWEITVKRKDEPDVEVISFDILIVATGLFTKPIIPHFKNQETFTGTILHSSKAVDGAVFRDKRVLVVGSGKSASDMATLASKYGLSSTMAFRQAHWALPAFAMGGKVSLRFLLMSRFASKLFPFYYKLNWGEWLYSCLKPIIKGIEQWIIMASKSDSGLPASHHLFPKNLHFWNDPGLSTVANEFYAAVKKGAIKTVLGQVEFAGDGKGVLFSDGTTGEFDLVILCTGYSAAFPFFDDHIKQQIQLENNDPQFPVLALYRLLVPLGSRSVGFVGYVNCIRNALTYELGAHWLSEYFIGRINPSETEMKKDLQKRLDVAKKLYNKDPKGGHSLLALDMYYDNHMLDDMKIPTLRTSNFFKEYFAPVYPIRYESLTQQKMAARKGIKLPPHKYLSFCRFIAILLVISSLLALVILLLPIVW